MSAILFNVQAKGLRIILDASGRETGGFCVLPALIVSKAYLLDPPPPEGDPDEWDDPPDAPNEGEGE